MEQLTNKRAYYIVNKEYLAQKRKERYEANKQHELHLNAIYYEKNKEAIKKWRKVYMKAYNKKRYKQEQLNRQLQLEKNQIKNNPMPLIGCTGITQQSTK